MGGAGVSRAALVTGCAETATAILNGLCDWHGCTARVVSVTDTYPHGVEAACERHARCTRCGGRVYIAGDGHVTCAAGACLHKMGRAV